MPGITLSELVSDHAEATVKYAGKEIHIEYAPGLVTEKALADMMQAGTKGALISKLAPKTAKGKKPTDLTAQDASHFAELLDFTGGLNALIARLVVSWDLLLDDHVTMYPITETVTTDGIEHTLPSPMLAEIPLGFRQAVLEAIFADLRLDPHKGM